VSENWSGRTLGIGDRLAGYEVESFVARGGMAVVYRARDLSLERTVALKVIAPELASNAKFRQRFVRESEIAASIDHPNIIPIYAAGEADQLLYLVMRYVPGEDLGAVLRERGPLRPSSPRWPEPWTPPMLTSSCIAM
jgi:serine/threonine protein kinase